MLARLINRVIVPCFIRLGFWLYNFMVARQNKDGVVTAVHFATSERDMNISMREYVESLDEQWAAQDRLAHMGEAGKQARNWETESEEYEN